MLPLAVSPHHRLPHPLGRNDRLTLSYWKAVEDFLGEGCLGELYSQLFFPLSHFGNLGIQTCISRPHLTGTVVLHRFQLQFVSYWW